MNADAPIVQVDHLSYAYNGRIALNDLTLKVHAGEAFALLGPNGSGKTTLFRILGTLIPPTDGRVAVLGYDLATQRDRIRPHLGVVFQSPSLDKQLTAEENLIYHGSMYGMSGSELRRRAHELLDRVDLGERAHERVSTFSGGMRRRVELAKALLTRPQLLLMDEPSTGLDPIARAELWRYLDEVRREERVTVVLTTHLMDEADRCDRVAILDRGRLVACDTPPALKERVGGDVITLVARDPQAARDALRRKLSVEVEIVSGALRLERPRGHEVVPSLIEALPGLVDSVAVGKPTLEDVFIHVTGHKFRDE